MPLFLRNAPQPLALAIALAAQLLAQCELIQAAAQGQEVQRLAALHLELCERLDDPRQAPPLLRLLNRDDDVQRAPLAERLRYDWFADDAVEHQIERLHDAQRARLAATWAHTASRSAA